MLNQRSTTRHDEEIRYRQATIPFDTPAAIVTQQWQWFAHARGAHSPGRLLDVGCGTGAFLGRARSEGWDVTGVELSSVSADIARQRLGNVVESVSLFDWQPPPARYDAITLWDVLDHLMEPEQALQRLQSVLQDDGVLVLRVRNGSWHLTVMRLYRIWRPLLAWLGMVKPPAVVHRVGFTTGALLDLLRRTGFKSVTVLPAAVTAGNRSGVWRDGGVNALGWLVGPLTRMVDWLARCSGNRLYLAPSLLLVARRS